MERTSCNPANFVPMLSHALTKQSYSQRLQNLSNFLNFSRTSCLMFSKLSKKNIRNFPQFITSLKYINAELTSFIWKTIAAATRFIPCTQPTQGSCEAYNFKTFLSTSMRLYFYISDWTRFILIFVTIEGGKVRVMSFWICCQRSQGSGGFLYLKRYRFLSYFQQKIMFLSHRLLIQQFYQQQARRQPRRVWTFSTILDDATSVFFANCQNSRQFRGAPVKFLTDDSSGKQETVKSSRQSYGSDIRLSLLKTSMLLILTFLLIEASIFYRDSLESLIEVEDVDLRRLLLQTPNLMDRQEQVEESLEDSQDLSLSLRPSINFSYFIIAQHQEYADGKGQDLFKSQGRSVSRTFRQKQKEIKCQLICLILFDRMQKGHILKFVITGKPVQDPLGIRTFPRQTYGVSQQSPDSFKLSHTLIGEHGYLYIHEQLPQFFYASQRKTYNIHKEMDQLDLTKLHVSMLNNSVAFHRKKGRLGEFMDRNGWMSKVTPLMGVERDQKGRCFSNRDREERIKSQRPKRVYENAVRPERKVNQEYYNTISSLMSQKLKIRKQRNELNDKNLIKTARVETRQQDRDPIHVQNIVENMAKTSLDFYSTSSTFYKRNNLSRENSQQSRAQSPSKLSFRSSVSRRAENPAKVGKERVLSPVKKGVLPDVIELEDQGVQKWQRTSCQSNWVYKPKEVDSDEEF